MVLILYCYDCKIDYMYGHHETCEECKCELIEMYRCDTCKTLLTEDEIINVEKGIECFELCDICFYKE